MTSNKKKIKRLERRVRTLEERTSILYHQANTHPVEHRLVPYTPEIAGKRRHP